MRLFLATAGSRGDVEPFLALARRARDEGHEVRLAVTREFEDTVRAAGIDTSVLDGNFADLVAAQGVSPWAAVRSFRTTVGPMMDRILRSSVAAAVHFRPDVIAHHPKILSAPLAAAHLDVPHVLCETVPVVTPTRRFPAPGVVSRDLGPLNRATYQAAAAGEAMFRGSLRDLRVQLGLGPNDEVPVRARDLVAVSPTLLSRPADWPSATVLTGQWYEPAADVAGSDRDLDDFLAGGPVVYAGFGSMATGNPEARARAVVGAARDLGLRTLVVTGWGGLALPGDLRGPDVLVREAVSHASVLPRCTVAVHHGGAGTSHAVVRAGTPSVVVPFLGDQPFWATLLHRRGFAAAPVPARALSRERLRVALSQAPEQGAVASAAASMRHEDGTGRAMAELAAVGA